MKNPKDEKFRMIKKTNGTIQKKLLGLKGGINELIQALGYVEVINQINKYQLLTKNFYRWMKNTTYLLATTLQY